MAITSFGVCSADDITDFNKLKEAIENDEPIENLGSNIQFTDLIKIENKDISISGSSNNGASFSADTGYTNKGAFQAKDGSLSIKGVKFDGFGKGSDKGIDSVIYSTGNVTLEDVEFGESIKTAPVGGRSEIGTSTSATVLMQGSNKTLTLNTTENGDVVFNKQTSGLSSVVDIYLQGSNQEMKITGEKGKVEIGTGIGSDTGNHKITHSGKNEFILGGNNRLYLGKYIQNNEEGTTTFKGTSYFKGDSDIQKGTFNWQANDDTSRGKLIFGEGTKLNVGEESSSSSSLTLNASKGDTIANTINMVVNTGSTLNLNSFTNQTLNNKISGLGTLNLTNDTITFSGDSSGLSRSLSALKITNSNLTLSGMNNDTETLTKIARATNDKTIINLTNYKGTDDEGLNVDGKQIKELNFSGTNEYTLGADKTLTVSADKDAEKEGVISNKPAANTTIKGDVSVGEANGEKIPTLENAANATLIIENGKTGLTNKGKVDNKGTLEASSIGNDGTITSTGSLTADTLINGQNDSDAILNATGTFTVNKGVTNNAKIKGANASFGTYHGSGEGSNLNLSGKLTITGDEEPFTNAIENGGSVTASAIEVKKGGVTNNGTIRTGDITLTSGDLTNGSTSNGTINASNITVSGDITNTLGTIEATGKITATDVTNSGTSIKGRELEFDNLVNNTGAIESTSGGITISGTADNENAGSITSTGELNVTGKLTNKGKIETNGGQLGAVDNSSSGSITNTGALTLSGAITGSDSTITNDGGSINLTGSASGYTGTFEQKSGTTTANSDALFGGAKNIKGGTLTASGSEMYQGAVDLSGGTNASFNYTLSGSEGSITKELLKFSEQGGNVKFTGNGASSVFTLSDDIENESLGSVTFDNAGLKLSKSSGEGAGKYDYKSFVLNNSTLKLGEESSNDIDSFTFANLKAQNNSKVDLDIKFAADNFLETDSLTITQGSGTLGLGNIFISDEKNVENGKSFTTKENEGVLRGSGAGVYGLKLSKGTKEGVKGATTAFEYDITVNNDQKGITANVSKIADENSLYKMDSEVSGERFFQFSTKDSQEYHIGKSLNETLEGSFTVQGKSTNRADSVLSGKLKKEGKVTEEKGSFFNVKTKKVDLTVKNMTIQDAESTDKNGSVLHNENAESKVVLDNLLIQNNSSKSDNGGAIYNNGGKGTDPTKADFTGLYVGNTEFKNNTSTGKGGAIYNDTEGFLYLQNVTTDEAIGAGQNDIYNAGTAYTNGKNTFNSLFTNEKDITFQGENTLSDFNNAGGTATFNGTNDVITKFTNNAAASVNSKNAQIDSYTSTNGKLNFNSSNAVLGTVTGDEGSSITNEGNLTLKGDGQSYAGNFSQTMGTFTVEKDSTFFGGSSSVIGGVLNWYTKNQPETAVLNVTGGTLNVGDNADNQGEITFKNGSSISKEVTTNIGKGSKLSVEEGGNVTLSNGAWFGNVSLADKGNLTLNNLNNKTQKGGTLNAQGGNLTLDGNTRLALGEGSIIASEVVTNIGKDSKIFLEQGTLTLDNSDTWAGAVVMEENTNGTLTFNGYTNSLGTLQASAGSVNVTNGSKITFGFDENKNYSGIVKNVKTTIDSNSEVTLNEGGYLELDDDAGTKDTWQGKVTLDGGIFDYGVKNPESVGELDAKKGKLNLLKDSLLNIENPSSVADNVSVDIQQGSTVDIKDGATFNIDSKTEDKWNGLVKNEGGNFNVSGMDNTKGHGGGIQQTKGTTTLTDESNIYISDSNSFITGGDVVLDGKSKLSFAAAGIQELNVDNLTMKDNTQLGILNNEINSAHAQEVTVDGTANFTVDLNARNKTGDEFDFGSISGNGTLNVSDFDFTGGAPIDRYIDFTLFTGDKSGVEFDATKDLKFTPIGYYGLESLGEGNYRAFLDHYNPQVFRGQVATIAMYTSQLLVDDIVTNHFILHNDRLLDNAKLANKYAAASALFAPYQKTYKEGGLWSKSYVSFDKMDLTHGLSVKNNIYGMLLGADLPAVELKNDWEFIPTGYVGYNGGHQHFDGVSMYQNGGQLGVMGTFIKDNFIGSVTAYGGGYMNDMDVAGFNDTTGNWFAGTAAKAAYNYELFKDFTVQPNLFIAYNAFGKQNWGTDFGVMSMNSGMLNGINIAPGLNLILQKDTWSLYGTVSYMYFANDKVDGYAGNVHLPNVRMDHGYLQYGIGGTKVWNDRLAAYGQVNVRNAGINGIGFQAGINYLFDLNDTVANVKNGTKAAGRGIAKGAKATGDGIVTASKATGNAIATGAKNAGIGIANGTKSAVNTISDGTQKTYVKFVRLFKNK